MSYPVYQVPAGDVLPIMFHTFAGATGASITITGLAVTDIEVYKDGSATQRSSDAGYALLDTDGIDFDGLTGIHGFSIDTGDNTDAGFYSVGAWFHVVVSAITVDGQTVSFVAAAFRLMAAEGVAGVPDVNVTYLADTAQSPGDIFGDSSDALPSLPTLASYLDTEIAAIKAKTDLLPSAAAGASGGLLINGSNTGAVTFDSGVTISNAGGNALTLTSSGGNGNGLQATGNGSGSGIRANGGATGAGLHAQGGATSGPGVLAEGQAGNANGVSCVANGSGTDLAADNLATSAQATAIQATTDKLDDMLVLSSDGWIYTVAALQDAPGGGTGLDAAGVRAAIGLASANLDAQLDALPTAAENATAVWGAGARTLTAIDEDGTTLDLDATIRAAVGLAAANLDTQLDALPTAAENATAVMASTIEGTFDLTESARLWNAALAGKASGLAGTAATFRDLADTKDRIVATVDADGNRTAVTRDVT